MVFLTSGLSDCVSVWVRGADGRQRVAGPLGKELRELGRQLNESTMRNWTPNSRQAKPAKKYWLRVMSIIGPSS